MESREEVYLKSQGQSRIWETCGGQRSGDQNLPSWQLFQQSDFDGEEWGEIMTDLRAVTIWALDTAPQEAL